MKRHTCRLIVTGVLTLALIHCTTPSADTRRNPDFRAQIATMHSIRTIHDHIKIYRSDHKTAPPSLKALHEEYDFDQRSLRDGWDRPLYYYHSNSYYVLASFGKDGFPDPQLTAPGGTVPYKDYDVDIVRIEGEWAQLPLNVNE